VADNVGVSARIHPVDIDEDGDIDFVADGNAEDHIYLWRNQASPPVGVPALPALAQTILAAVLAAVAHRKLRATRGHRS